VAPWGWTWIDQAPWGFAPFHYGRWVIIRGRWAWVPGRYEARPVYAPALVGWIGNGGWSLSFSFGTAPAVGWFPLAPREVYVPAYRYSPTYLRQVNITHVHDVTVIERAARPGSRESHVYRERPQAVTVVPSSSLREGRPINRREIRQPDRRELEQAPQIRQVPAPELLAPASPPAVVRPQREERREPSFVAPMRTERPSPPVPANRQADDQPMPRIPPPVVREAPSSSRQIETAPAVPRREMREEVRQPAPPVEQRPPAPPAAQRERPREAPEITRPAPEPMRQERVAPREVVPQGQPSPPREQIEPPRSPPRENSRSAERRDDKDERGRGKREP
jgi:hypothetical protein